MKHTFRCIKTEINKSFPLDKVLSVINNDCHTVGTMSAMNSFLCKNSGYFFSNESREWIEEFKKCTDIH